MSSVVKAFLCELCVSRFFSGRGTDLKGLPTLISLQHHRRNRSHPVIHQAVALQTLRRKSLRNVIRILRLLEIVHVAARALCRQPLPVGRAHRPDLVARIAIHHGVRPDQREAILMLIDVVDGDLPPGVAVARVTLRGIPTPVNIGVAVLALVVRLGENQVGMTIRAADFRVQSAQRKACLAVIKLGNRSNRRPPLRRVAILARDVQLSVWAVGLLLRPGLSAIEREHSRMKNHHQRRE